MAELNAQPIATKASHDPDFRAGDTFKASNPAILLRMLPITRVVRHKTSYLSSISAKIIICLTESIKPNML